MRRVVGFGLVMVFLASSAIAVEILAFKKASRYGAASMEVAGFEKGRDGRLLIRGTNGGLYTADAADVDWNLSRLMTEALRKEKIDDAKLLETKERAQVAAAKLTSRSRQTLSLVEASRRFGVDSPALVTASGTAARELPARSAGSDDAPAARPSGPESARTKRTRARLDAAKAKLGKLDTELKKLRADRNPDMVSAAIRQSRIDRLTEERTAVSGQIASLTRDLEATIAADSVAAERDQADKS